jgi:hypothetical protein
MIRKGIFILLILLLVIPAACKHQFIQTGESNDGYLRLEVDPSNAKVYVDDIYVGIAKDFSGRDLRKTEKMLRVSSGHHILRFELDKYITQEREVYAGHSVQTVSLRLKPE